MSTWASTCWIALAKKATHLLGLDYDIEIVEKHHHNKVDAPSAAPR